MEHYLYIQFSAGSAGQALSSPRYKTVNKYLYYGLIGSTILGVLYGMGFTAFHILSSQKGLYHCIYIFIFLSIWLRIFFTHDILTFRKWFYKMPSLCSMWYWRETRWFTVDTSPIHGSMHHSADSVRLLCCSEQMSAGCRQSA